MKEYSLAEQFALIALNGQDSQHNTEAKTASVLGIAAAQVLQELLNAGGETYLLVTADKLAKQIRAIKKMSRKERKTVEGNIVHKLKEAGVLWEIPNLLGCDIDFYTAEVTMREYKCDEEEYQRIVESIRAEILEPGEVSLETVCMLWLLRESGIMHDIFSVEEQNQIEQRLLDMKVGNEAYKIVLELEFHSGVRKMYLHYLNWKKNLFKNPYLAGVNLVFPFFERKQAVFIDMVILGTSVENRRKATVEFLRTNGHSCEEVKNGSETLLKIDNSYYRIWPSTRNYQLPVQGIELQPVYR